MSKKKIKTSINQIQQSVINRFKNCYVLLTAFFIKNLLVTDKNVINQPIAQSQRALITHPDGRIPAPQRHRLTIRRAIVANALTAVPAVVQRDERPERVVAAAAVAALVVRRPVRGPGAVLYNPLRDVQHGRDGRQGIDDGLGVLSDRDLAVVDRARYARGDFLVAVVAHPHVRVPAAVGHGLVVRRARLAETFAAIAAMVLGGVRQERCFALVTVLKQTSRSFDYFIDHKFYRLIA